MGRGNAVGSGIYSGGGYGGKGGEGCFNNNCVAGGISYGEADLPCELGSGSGNDSLASFSSGGGIIGEFIVCMFYFHFETSIQINTQLLLNSLNSHSISLLHFCYICSDGLISASIVKLIH